MIRTLAACAALLCLTSPARADRFWFGSEKDTEKLVEGSAAPDLEGVLLEEKDGMLTIRVEGGTVTVPKSTVYKIEKTDLAVADLEKREQQSREQLAQLNEQRRQAQAQAQAQAQEAAAQREQAGFVDAGGQPGAAQGTAEPAAREVTIVIDFQGLLPNYAFRVYDPVLHRMNWVGLQQLITDYVRYEAERAAYRRF